jgi:predicted transcriptional regulator
MNLKKYLLEACLTPVEFAAKCDVCPVTIYKMLKGKRVTVPVARKVIEASGGKVTSEEILLQNY